MHKLNDMHQDAPLPHACAPCLRLRGWREPGKSPNHCLAISEKKKIPELLPPPLGEG